MGGGIVKERFTLEITDNETKAYIIYNHSLEDLDLANRESLIRETLTFLNQKGIVHGIKKNLFNAAIVNGVRYLIAEGTPAIDGKDAEVRLYQLQEVRPEVREDGKVDYYELKLINRVTAGNWLGERIEATDGIPGKTVYGSTIKPVKGKTIPLNYDKNSVKEVYENGKTTLFAKINGAVNYTNGKLNVSNFLEVNEVGIPTGNIKFDGYLTVKGTVCDGFSVEATKDIEINSSLGLGNPKSIISTGGSIYIKGGISSKTRVFVKAAKNVFIKFLDNVDVYCGGTAHIGYYCLNSNIEAKEIFFDAPNGKIIGGNLKADIRIAAPFIGSESERKTIIEVKGFNRQGLIESLEALLRKISELKTDQQRLRSAISTLNSGSNNVSQKNELSELSDKLYKLNEQIKNLEEERKNIANYLRTRGEGEIIAQKKIFPNCTLILSNNVVGITEPTIAVDMYVVNGEIKYL
jgi:uncharacterized protein (DUF342 family)